MSKLATFRVHIAPLGFEIDRIVIPLKETKADKLWLLVHEKTAEDKSGPYLEKIKTQCKKLGIKIEIYYVDRLSIFKVIKAVKEIILQEKNNYIYVNVASGSKIQAIACMMACMILKECKNIQPFYAEPETYAAFEGKQQSFGIKDTIPLPTYEIQTPKQKLLDALKIVHRYHESEFIKSWQKLVRNPKERLVISKPENIKFYDDCKKLVDSISKVHAAAEEIPEKKPHNLLLKKILEIDNQIRLLKKQQSEKRSTSK